MSAIIDPQDFIKQFKYLEKFKNFIPPKICVLTFTGDFTSEIKKMFEISEKGPYGLTLSKIKNKLIGLKQCKVGTSSATIDLEILHALGIKTFISVGSAGGLDNNLEGQIVYGNRAISDDGISIHYPFPSSGIIENKSKLISKWKEFYPEISPVTAWTTSAPYRETKEKFIIFKKKGASIVDMEMASLNAVAKYRKIEILNIFVISDILNINGWKLLNNNYYCKMKQACKMIKNFI